MNPNNYEAWKDDDGGEWIRLKVGVVENVIWRPANLQITADDQIKFDVELFNGPGITPITEENEKIFGNFCRSIITDMLRVEAEQVNQLRETYELVENLNSEEEAEEEEKEEDDFKSRFIM